MLATVPAGQSYVVAGVASDEVVSVQSGSSFSFQLSPEPTTDPTEPTEPEPPCTDPVSCTIVTSILAHWQCDGPNCWPPDWLGSVIAWPEGAAYQNNARSGNNARRVFSADGEPLYPYMGGWADGCQVTAIEGTALIIEWQRGTDVWRETHISPGESHTIQLAAPEDGAMIESNDYTEFSVSLTNCEPEPL
jgi:hypothetical protein